MTILYRTAKFKSANTFAMAIWDSTAKFNSCQYFRLYGNVHLSLFYIAHCSTGTVLAGEAPRSMHSGCDLRSIYL